jgi:hypothetical protein
MVDLLKQFPLPMLILSLCLFLLRVATPRSRLTRWPRPGVCSVLPGRGCGRGVRLRSASVTILLPMELLWKKWWKSCY